MRRLQCPWLRIASLCERCRGGHWVHVLGTSRVLAATLPATLTNGFCVLATCTEYFVERKTRTNYPAKPSYVHVFRDQTKQNQPVLVRMLASDHYCLSAPSKEIRLLDLLPGTDSGMLAGRLRRVSIDHTPPFVSISHVWGHGKAETLMHLESGCGNKKVQISTNLEAPLLSLLCHDSATLPQLWSNGSMMPMWVDMACINQADIGEKASQIPLMRRIYSQATSVVIWIHESESRLVYAFHYLRRILNARPSICEDQV